MKNLYEHILHMAAKQPEKPALIGVDEGGTTIESYAYAQLIGAIDSAASELRAMSLQPGDRIALAFRNSPALLVWSWAAWASGIVTVPMDTKRDTAELYAYKINLNKAKVLITERGIRAEKLPGVRFKVHTGFDAEIKPVEWLRDLSHQALVLFTSGTTGHPKGAMLSLENLIVNADGIREWLQITGDDTFQVNLPLHHINSTTFCLAMLLAGGSVTIPPQYSNSRFWQQVARSGATITSIVQSILFDQLHREEEFKALKDRIKLSRIQIGSAPVLPQSVIEFTKRFGIKLYQGYGQTETALRVTGVPMDVEEALYERLVDENSIGEPMAWADLQIADGDGKFLGEGEEGELVVRGAAVMEGYLGREPAFRDGYFLTGDIGYYRVIDGRKFFYLKGRKREIIIKGGINISPVAVENALAKISPEVEQVHAVPVPDERYGEEIGAVISWKEGTDEDSAKRRLKCALLLGTPFLSAYEAPKYIASLPVSQLPMTSTGKVQRSVLKEQLPYEKFESIYGLLKTPEYRFTVLHRGSRWENAAYELYAHCWQDLAEPHEAFDKELSKLLTILAAKPDGSLAGEITLLRTSLSAQELTKLTYDELSSGKFADRAGTALVCLSICSASFTPKAIPKVTRKPDEAGVKAYLPQDPVFKFHAKAKAGQQHGAKLLSLIPGGRPDDRTSLGYTMLLHYPDTRTTEGITPGAPVSDQLIEFVLLIGKDLGIKDVYAYSRPGGLASYLSTH